MPATRNRPPRPRGLRRRALVNRLNLTTPLGLLVARLGGATLSDGPDGLVLAEGYRLRFPVAAAFTVGNVVLTQYRFADLGEPMLRHEDRHAWQYAHLGLAFLPLYGFAAAWSLLRFGNPAWGNPFEERAGLVTGNYLAAGTLRPAPRRLVGVLRGLRRR